MARDQDVWKKRKRAEPSATVHLDDAIALPVGADATWAYLQDVRAVAACIPGLVPDSVEQVSDDTFTGTMKHVALGVPSTWLLTAHVGRDDDGRRLDVDLEGDEPRLSLRLEGGARLRIVDAQPARLAYTGELSVRGRLAGAGGPVIERVIGSIIERFVQNLGSAGEVPPRHSWWRRTKERLRLLFARRSRGRSGA
jgi:carbon monoxide dehydrogenase subunit G